MKNIFENKELKLLAPRKDEEKKYQKHVVSIKCTKTVANGFPIENAKIKYRYHMIVILNKLYSSMNYVLSRIKLQIGTKVIIFPWLRISHKYLCTNMLHKKND